MLVGVARVARSHLQLRAVLGHLEALARDDVQQLVLLNRHSRYAHSSVFVGYLVIVSPLLVALHAVARENHYVLPGEVYAGLVATDLAVFTEHPVLNQRTH